MLDMGEGVLCEELLLAFLLLTSGRSTSTSTPNPVDATIAMLVRTCIHACAGMHMDNTTACLPNTCHPHCMHRPFPTGWRLVRKQALGNPTPSQHQTWQGLGTYQQLPYIDALACVCHLGQCVYQAVGMLRHDGLVCCQA